MGDLKNLRAMKIYEQNKHACFSQNICYSNDEQLQSCILNGVRSKQTRSKQTIHNRPLKTDHVHNRPIHNRPVHNRLRS